MVTWLPKHDGFLFLALVTWRSGKMQEMPFPKGKATRLFITTGLQPARSKPQGHGASSETPLEFMAASHNLYWESAFAEEEAFLHLETLSSPGPGIRPGPIREGRGGGIAAPPGQEGEDGGFA
jgi:hypothetical protein